eukprot:m.51031 g.51031  ORF g.51031 m.51031 type:complete len:567 (+) comp12194_c0_seq1:132-1832(+)
MPSMGAIAALLVAVLSLIPDATARPAAIGDAKQRQPNILLIMPDELRYDWGGLANNPYFTAKELPLRTPHFDRLAIQGTRFTKAVTAAPVCAPSRATFASGRTYDTAGQGENGLSTSPDRDGDFAVETIPTFFQGLQEAGYFTMVTGRDDLTKKTGPGLDGMFHAKELGFNASRRCAASTDVVLGQENNLKQLMQVHDPYGAWLNTSNCTVSPAAAKKYGSTNCFEIDGLRQHEILSRGLYNSEAWYAIPDPRPLPQVAYQDDWIGRATLETLADKPDDQPWFLWVNHQAPHPPEDITVEMNETMRGRGPWPTPYECNATEADLCVPETLQLMQTNYAAKIERIDYWLGRYLQALELSGELKDTVICLASDHGEMLGDRAATAKEKPWQSSLGIPLVCMGPDIARGRMVDFPVTLMDLGATFLDIGGGRKPPGMNSTTFLPLMQASIPLPPRPPRTLIHSGLRNFRSVIEYVNETHVYKFFCCTGVCAGSTASDSKVGKTGERGLIKDEYHLFNMALYDKDPSARFEPPYLDLRLDEPDTVARLAALLPPKHKERRAGYTWKGCRI